MATILVVGDERLICDLLRLVLASHGHDVIVASTGDAALELFASRKPRLTIMDIGMTESDVMELLKQIHRKDPLAAVMILTATTTGTLKRQAQDSGVIEFLSKEIPLDDLIGTVNRAITQSPKTAPPPLPWGKGTKGWLLEPASILVVDDDPTIRNLLTDFLSTRGYRVQTAPDGPTTLALVGRAAPQLIVLDIQLPGMNGVTVLRELRARQYTGGVIVLSGSKDEKLLTAMLEMGAVELLPKPFDLERLALAIQVGLILSKS
ncbi:MAG: response regulator [Nitrospirales bacterium]|nr:response regulator [Nitrospirales bacterium]